MSSPVPIETTADLARTLELTGLAIVGFDAGRRSHVTTWGATAEEKVIAARIGDRVQQWLHEPGETVQVHADFRRDHEAGKLREQLDAVVLALRKLEDAYKAREHGAIAEDRCLGAIRKAVDFNPPLTALEPRKDSDECQQSKPR